MADKILKDVKEMKPIGSASKEYEEFIKNLEKKQIDQPTKKAKGGQAKVGRVMKEFKKGELHSGKKGPVVKNPKQAIAIALSEAGMSKPQKKQDGGMVRFKKQYQMHNGKF
jgi:hypothetical protein